MQIVDYAIDIETDRMAASHDLFISNQIDRWMLPSSHTMSQSEQSGSSVYVTFCSYASINNRSLNIEYKNNNELDLPYFFSNLEIGIRSLVTAVIKKYFARCSIVCFTIYAVTVDSVR